MKSRQLLMLSGLATFALIATVGGIAAHPGGLDKNGGHRNRKTGEYHYHRQPSSSRTSPGASVAAPPDAGQLGSSKLLPDYSSATASQKVDALVALLEAKGVLTKAEVLEQLRSDADSR